MTNPIALGLDFGTESVRAILVDTQGRQLSLATDSYAHGQITEALPSNGQPLPPTFALQDPSDWIESAVIATRAAIADSSLDAAEIVGVGVDFTSCTMLPTTAAGTPLCMLDDYRGDAMAWPKLWKHHGALTQTERMNRIAQARGESFLARYGGSIGLEWFFPKIMETAECSANVAEAAEVWLEAGDWFVWQLVGGPAELLTRSTCQAGYKAMWSADDGYPSADFFGAVHPYLVDVVANRLPGVMRSPGEAAGGLTAEMSARMGIKTGTAVATAIIDAHAAVPGVGAAEPGVLVMVMGTSSCHMLNATSLVDIPGVAGVVDGGILPGLLGYETGQAAVGDAFAWLLRLLNLDSFDALSADAMKLPPGADGVHCMDWFNGCRTPLMDGGLRGAFTGLGLEHGPHHLYLALMEASAMGLRWIVDLLRDGGAPMTRFIATGGLPHHSRSFVEVCADVLGVPIEIHPTTQGPAVGAAVLGMMAAGPQASGLESVSQAAQAMAGAKDERLILVEPRRERHQAYLELYSQYRQLASALREL